MNIALSIALGAFLIPIALTLSFAVIRVVIDHFAE